MTQQTALEQLLDSIPLRFKNALLNECTEEIRQALAREKSQIKRAYCDGNPQFEDCAEDYFQENYGR